MNPPDTPTITGYPRAEVEDFLTAAAAERTRLEATIADAEARVSRARSAIGAHQVMVAMLLESQQELTRIRRDAEAEAEAIVAAAERDAQLILSGQAVEAGAPLQPVADPIELFSAPGTSLDGAPRSTDGDDPDEFFSFLRGALADDRPLGPPAE